jgi:hypothetical protein
MTRFHSAGVPGYAAGLLIATLVGSVAAGRDEPPGRRPAPQPRPGRRPDLGSGSMATAIPPGGWG